MAKIIDLRGNWKFCLDAEKAGLKQHFYQHTFTNEISLPTTVSEAKKSEYSEIEETGFLTDPYQYEGYSWYSREVEFTDATNKELFLVLERTRVSHVWVDNCYVGNNNSLCTSHRYHITPYIKNSLHKLTIMVDNTSYPVKGGHMASPDTQTNWNGITGGIQIEILNTTYLSGVKIYPDALKKEITVKAILHGADQDMAVVQVKDASGILPVSKIRLVRGENHFTYSFGEDAKLWSEHTPHLYHLQIELNGDSYEYTFGLRDFSAGEKYLIINGNNTFLRGKHDGLIFPMTGYTPTDVESWLKVLGTAKEYGINHYRYHTSCPTDAAFTAADILGIYMEPELPFWGTVTEAGEENHDEAALQYLIGEGYRILDEFGNHPSFVMMSLGNELWGSQRLLNEILGRYKEYDNRHLYTQGSNNFQFAPCILENEDFYCGVRFSRDRLFRGSYAMCDAPQGHIQTMAPDTIYNYDQMIRPRNMTGEGAVDGEITIQYGTGTKTVKMSATDEVIPKIPVVSHEIGQYTMYPDYSEIGKYTGVLKARNLEVFQRRLEKQGMLAMADQFFQSSGKLAVDCYKAELETALRSSELGGFQILDLQDFTGQGTALIGVLNSFMESKGLISGEEWRQFCSDTVILAELPKHVYQAGECVRVGVKLSHFNQVAVTSPKIILTLTDNQEINIREEKEVVGEYAEGVYQLGGFDLQLPIMKQPLKLHLNLSIHNTEVQNNYSLWVYPALNVASVDNLVMSDNLAIEDNLTITDNWDEALMKLQEGGKVLLYPSNLDEHNSIEGTYCTDFWCYPMFRSISESVGRPVPIGTQGLLIEQKHPVFNHFPTENYTTPQWYDIVSNSRAMILDDTKLEPTVWVIDNFERNHRLGMMFEVKVGDGKLFVCTSDLRSLKDSLPAQWLRESIIRYMNSDAFDPTFQVNPEELRAIYIR